MTFIRWNDHQVLGTIYILEYLKETMRELEKKFNNV